MPASVRRAVVDDALAIARIHVLTWQSAYRGIIPQDVLDGLSIPKRLEMWGDRLNRLEHSIWVLEADGEIQGWATVGPSRDADLKDAAELYGIYLAPQYWSKGLGSLLYRRAEEAMGGYGRPEFTVWVLEANSRARRFYERNGYKPDGATRTATQENVSLTELRHRKVCPGGTELAGKG